MKLEEFKSLSFDQLQSLYEKDPVSYQLEMEEVLDDFISKTEEPNRTKLKQLQWRINGELRHYKDPIARYNKMIELFWKGVNDFNNALKGNFK